MDRNAIALPDPPGLQAGDQLADEFPGGVAGDGARRIRDIDVNLAWNQSLFVWVVESDSGRILTGSSWSYWGSSKMNDSRSCVETRTRRSGSKIIVTATVANPDQCSAAVGREDQGRERTGRSERNKAFGPTQNEAFPAGSPGRGCLAGFGH